VKVHLHNEFVKHIKELKEEITVSELWVKDGEKLTYLSRRRREEYLSPQTAGQRIQQRWVFLE
jgi:hypothetical protein